VIAFSHRSSQSCEDAGVICAGFGLFCFLPASVLGGVVGRSGGSSETVSCSPFWAAIAAGNVAAVPKMMRAA